MKDNPERARQRSKDWYEKNKELVKERRAQYYQDNKEKADAQAKEWAKANPEKVRWSTIKHRYKITQEQWEAILDSQNGVCAICLVKQDSYHVDHDHSCCQGRNSCGKCIRGLLCGPCNKALGLMKDNKEAILRMTEYL